MFGFAMASVQLGGVIGEWLTDRVGRRAVFRLSQLLTSIHLYGFCHIYC
jgi:MFS family permease